MAKSKPLKEFKLTYVGKGKKKPVLPAGDIGTLKAGGDACLITRMADNTVLMDVAGLIGDAKLAKQIVKVQREAGNVADIIVSAEGEKKVKAAFVPLRQAVLIAATAQTFGVRNEVTRTLLGLSMGHGYRKAVETMFLNIGLTENVADIK